MSNVTIRLLVDIERTKGAFVGLTDRGKKIVFVSAGKEIFQVPQRERTYKIYKLLEEHCDVIFCTSQKVEDFPFYPVPRFSIFAVDSKGNCFGTIGGSGNLIDDVYPVGYVNCKGMSGKIANSLKEFLELVTFYPNWREYIGIDPDINAQYLAGRQEIAETLKLSHNPRSIELLISNLKNPFEFMVYSSKDEARKTNTFFEDMDQLIRMTDI